jgi:hypothetical protein
MALTTLTVTVGMDVTRHSTPRQPNRFTNRRFSSRCSSQAALTRASGEQLSMHSSIDSTGSSYSSSTQRSSSSSLSPVMQLLVVSMLQLTTAAVPGEGQYCAMLYFVVCYKFNCLSVCVCVGQYSVELVLLGYCFTSAFKYCLSYE